MKISNDFGADVIYDRDNQEGERRLFVAPFDTVLKIVNDFRVDKFIEVDRAENLFDFHRKECITRAFGPGNLRGKDSSYIFVGNGPVKETHIHARLSLHRRDLQTAEHHARYLSSLGFRVLKASERGVDFEGSFALFEEAFQQSINSSGDAFSFAADPILPASIRHLVESVYFPTKPIYF